MTTVAQEINPKREKVKPITRMPANTMQRLARLAGPAEQSSTEFRNLVGNPMWYRLPTQPPHTAAD